jgi:hypothetical protein
VCGAGQEARSAAKGAAIGNNAPWLDRMDRHFDDKFFNDSDLKTRPKLEHQTPVEIELQRAPVRFTRRVLK